MTLVSMVSILLSSGRAVSLGTTFLPSLLRGFSDRELFLPTPSQYQDRGGVPVDSSRAMTLLGKPATRSPSSPRTLG